MMAMKYIIIEAKKYFAIPDKVEATFPILFPNELAHRHVADYMIHALRMGDGRNHLGAWDEASVYSAGFCRINSNGFFECWGESESLSIKSQPHYDTRCLQGMNR